MTKLLNQGLRQVHFKVLLLNKWKATVKTTTTAGDLDDCDDDNSCVESGALSREVVLKARMEPSSSPINRDVEIVSNQRDERINSGGAKVC